MRTHGQPLRAELSASGRASRLAPLLLFFAFTSAFGIAAHLLAELAGLGAHDDAEVAFSARHAYLALIALVALGALGGAFLSVRRGARRTLVGALIARLPFRGEGPAFAGLCFVAQFGFFAVTQLGEGCPLCAGDLAVGILAAATAAAAGALAVTLGKRRFLELALTIVWYLASSVSADSAVLGGGIEGRVVIRAARRTPFAFRYRPPPSATAA